MIWILLKFWIQVELAVKRYTQDFQCDLFIATNNRRHIHAKLAKFDWILKQHIEIVPNEHSNGTNDVSREFQVENICISMGLAFDGCFKLGFQMT